MSYAEIKKAINSDFINEPLDAKTDRIEVDTQDIQTKVNTINTNVGSNADASSASGSVHAKLKDIKAFSNIKSIQTGYIESDLLTLGTGEDLRYLNITISAIDASKCIIFFDGGFGASTAEARLKTSGANTGKSTSRLTSAVNLRISAGAGFTHMAGRYQVIEFN